jgi:hypothetical protein
MPMSSQPGSVPAAIRPRFVGRAFPVWLVQWMCAAVAGTAIFLFLAYAADAGAGRHYAGAAADPPFADQIVALLLAALAFAAPVLNRSEERRLPDLDGIRTALGIAGISLVLIVADRLYADRGPWNVGPIALALLFAAAMAATVMCCFLPRTLAACCKRERVAETDLPR